MNQMGIQAKHLEQRDDYRVQENFIEEEDILKMNLKNYNRIIKSTISLPVTEFISTEQINELCNIIKENIYA